MEYINKLKAKAHIGTLSRPEQPVLSEEDEAFLNRITANDQPPPLPARSYKSHGGDAQVALMDGAQNIALPAITPDEERSVFAADPSTLSEEPSSMLDVPERRPARKTWSWLRRDSRNRKDKGQQVAVVPAEVSQGPKPADAKPNEDDIVSDEEAKKEEEEMSTVLEQLNLAAVNNRVFSISDETQDLLKKFNQVFQDLIKGVPTAYGDLESLLNNGDQQLQKTYNSLPTFLQRLIEKLPENFTKTLSPEIMAVAAERASRSGINLDKAGKAAGMASKMLKTPSLKDIVAKPGAIAGMLRSIFTFLRARFPAFMGMNVLWSLALFVLLFVFGYCHKRGKEVRLGKERDLTEQEVQRMEAEYRARHPDEVLTTTAAPGAPMSQVQEGMREAEAIRAARAAYAHSSDTVVANYQPSRAAHTKRLSTST